MQVIRHDVPVAEVDPYKYRLTPFQLINANDILARAKEYRELHGELYDPLSQTNVQELVVDNDHSYYRVGDVTLFPEEVLDADDVLAYPA